MYFSSYYSPIQHLIFLALKFFDSSTIQPVGGAFGVSVDRSEKLTFSSERAQFRNKLALPGRDTNHCLLSSLIHRMTGQSLTEASRSIQSPICPAGHRRTTDCRALLLPTSDQLPTPQPPTLDELPTLR
ncbi:hypothetical protein SRHO_G00147390 [Serrasalmus rhombeus]